MSAKARMAARKKSDKMGIAWERKYAECKRCMEMPKKGTSLHTWQKTQLGNAHASLNAKIQKELAENKGSTVWSERRVKLFDCVEQKNRVKTVTRARGSMLSSNHTTGCQRKEPRYILGNRIS